MRYSNVFIEAISYQLAPVVVTSRELEARLKPVYQTLHISGGQLEALTGIVERRWWPEGFRLSDGAILAAQKALNTCRISPKDIGSVLYTGVCRDNFEPATACRIADGLGVSADTAVYDISNACLGVLNGMLDIANRIELGQIRAGLIVSCESAREINEIMIAKLLATPDINQFSSTLATFTGSSGAVAVLLSDGSFSTKNGHHLLGGVIQAAPEHHDLCRWGLQTDDLSGGTIQFMTTDSSAILKTGVAIGIRTWSLFLQEMGWRPAQIDKVILHQVGLSHQHQILNALQIPIEKDFSTFKYLGNMGTVSLPLTAALADENEFLDRGQKIGLLGIGSGLNCLMLGVEW